MFAGAFAWCTLDMIQGYWRALLSRNSQETYTMVAPELLSTPCRVPPGVVDTTAYFHGTMGDIFEG